MNRIDSGRRFRLFASQTFGCNFWMLCLPVTAFIVDGFYDGKAAINKQATTVPRLNQSCIWLSQCYQLNERSSFMATATIIGSGPNGLSAAIVLASAGVSTTVVERNQQIGGACSTAETTLPGFRHDLGSSVYPMGIASPFFRALPIYLPLIQ